MTHTHDGVSRLRKEFQKPARAPGHTAACDFACRCTQVDDTQYTSDHIVLAVGGQPVVPDVPGSELAMDSNGFFDIEKQPEK